jgi:hypothetical protein
MREIISKNDLEPGRPEISIWSLRILCWTPKTTNVKVKQSRYRPGVAQKVPGSLVSQIFLTMTQDGGKVVSLTHRPHLSPGNTPGTHFC